MFCIAFVLIASAAAADTSVLAKARAILSDPSLPIPSDEQLAKVAEACKGSTEPTGAVMKACAGYEKLKDLLKRKPTEATIKKLEKANIKAEAKLKAAKDTDGDDLLLESKEDKKEREEQIAAAEKAVEKVQAKLAVEQEALAAHKPRETLADSWLAELVERYSGAGKLQVLHKSPMVVVVDDWMGAAVKGATAKLETALLDALNHTGAETALPDAADKILAASEYTSESKPRLCLPVADGKVDATLLASVQVRGQSWRWTVREVGDMGKAACLGGLGCRAVVCAAWGFGEGCLGRGCWVVGVALWGAGGSTMIVSLDGPS